VTDQQDDVDLEALAARFATALEGIRGLAALVHPEFNLTPGERAHLREAFNHGASDGRAVIASVDAVLKLFDSPVFVEREVDTEVLAHLRAIWEGYRAKAEETLAVIGRALERLEALPRWRADLGRGGPAWGAA